MPSQFTAGEVERRLERAGRSHFGLPARRAGLDAARPAAPTDGYVLFLGTLEPRKNVGGLLDAYERCSDSARARPPTSAEPRQDAPVPELVLAGQSAPRAAQPWLDRIARPPLAGIVRHVGYVDPARRRELYEGARLLVQPSFDEGFGLPVLEAMTLGVPVVAANRGALPEVLGDAGLLVDPDDPDQIAAAIAPDAATTMASPRRARRRACCAPRSSTGSATAQRVYAAYQRAIEHRQCASA